MRYASFNINFDSLGEMYGFPAGYRDPSFFSIADRFFRLSRKYGFKYTIFVIGRDLEKAENRARVKDWAGEGHEIANHSWSHPLDLGSLPPPKIREEVRRAHEAIASATGREPKGFTAPGWSTSEALLRELIELDYRYDASVFPSWLLYPQMAKMLWNHAGGERFLKILGRRDLAGPWRFPTSPFFSEGKLYQSGRPGGKGLWVLPLPCGAMRMASWHTTTFVFGEKLHQKLLRSALRRSDAFYYLTHPGDLMDVKDTEPARPLRIERLHPGLDEKQRRLERSFEAILAEGREVLTMEGMVEKIYP